MKKLKVKVVASLAILSTLVLENVAPVFAASYEEDSRTSDLFYSNYQINIDSVRANLGSSVSNLIRDPRQIWTKDSYYSVIPVIDESKISSITVDGKNIGKNASNQYYFVPTENKTYTIVATDKDGNTQTIVYEEEYVVNQGFGVANYVLMDPVIHVNPQSNRAVKGIKVNQENIKVEENNDGTFFVYTTENRTYTVILTYSNNEEETITFVETRFDSAVEALEMFEQKLPVIKIIPTSNEKKGEVKSVEVINQSGTVTNISKASNGEYLVVPMSNGTINVRISYSNGDVDNVEYTESRIVEIEEPEAKYESGWNYNVYFKLKNTNSDVYEVTVDGKKVEKDSRGYYSFSPDKRGEYKIVARNTIGHTAVYVYDETEFRDKGEAVAMEEGTTHAIYIYPKTAKKVVRATYNGSEITNVITNEGFFYLPKENGKYVFYIEYEGGEKEEITYTETRFGIKAEGIERNNKPAVAVIPNSTKGQIEKVEYTLENGAVLLAKAEADGTYVFSVDKNQRIDIKATYVNGATDSTVFTETRISGNNSSEENKEDKNENNNKNDDRSEDNTDNTKSDISTTEYTDTEKPVIISVESSSEADEENKYMIELKITDNIGVTEVTVNGVNITDSLEDGKYRFKVAKNGEYVIVAKDAEGNTAEHKYVEAKYGDGELPAKVDPYEGTDPMRLPSKYDPYEGTDPTKLPVEIENIYDASKNKKTDNTTPKTDKSESSNGLPFTGSQIGSFAVITSALAVTVISWIKMRKLN